jgi:hypothetical protein
MTSGQVNIIVPSMGRAGHVQTQKAVSAERLILCVPDSEVDGYRQAHPDMQVIGHPDSVVGLSQKRQWIYDKWGDVVMIDDDCDAILHLEHGLGDKPCVLSPADGVELCDRLLDEAKSMGVYLFGLASSVDIRNYVAVMPFRTIGWVNGGFTGLVAGSKLFYHPKIMCSEDFWISALNAYFHRKIWADTRYALRDAHGSGTMKTPGGMAFIRSLEAEKRDNEILARHFGDAVKPRPKKAAGRVKEIHEFQRALTIPW